jgi:hypothetical protein
MLFCLGFPTKLHASDAGMFSAMKRREWMRCRSLKAFAGSLCRAVLASSGWEAKSRGTGPLRVAPSK